MSITSILGPTGTIANQLDQYEPRPQQLEMAEAVENAIDDNHHLIVEAGTGVGKSFAYLVPAMLAAITNKSKEQRIVVSTHTISLQEQLINKDIPFLQDVLPDGVRPVLVKGRSNYISLRRLRVAQQRMGLLLADPMQARQMTQIGRWSRQTRDGSRSDLDFQPDAKVWDLVESDGGNCLGRSCPEYEKCFYFKARRKIWKANILIVNHALFFTDLKLRRMGNGFLPEYQVAILDEAHTAEDVASERLGLQISRGAFDYNLNKLFNPRNNRGLLSALGSKDTNKQVDITRGYVDQFFDAIQSWSYSQPRRGPRLASESVRVPRANIVVNPLSEELKKLATQVVEHSKHLEDEAKIEYVSVADRLLVLAEELTAWVEQALPEQVYWIDSTASEFKQRITLASAPIDVGPTLKEYLYDTIPTVVMTSATLSVGGKQGFQYFKDRIGLDEAETKQLGSPFDYQELVELHLFRKIPDPSKVPEKHEAELVRLIPEYLEKTDGGAFVLFTSYSAMRKMTDKLRPWMQQQGMTLISQSDGLPRSQMVDQFRHTEKAVLFGVDSFWQGVDVPGEALRNVMITKLPFVAPDRPILAARQEAIQARGGQPFMEYQVPQAVIKLKQGFGRLVRTSTDKGLVVIFDPRVLTKGYGKAFLDALPECPRVVDGVPVT